MAVAHVRVTSAVAGTELLPRTAFPCVGFEEQLLAALGSRPSRKVTLFQNGVMVDDLQVAADGDLELTAVVGDVLTAEEREALLEQIADEELNGVYLLFFQVLRGRTR